MRFFFDYIYFRIARAYFRSDGRTGGRAIIAITMIQMICLFDVAFLPIRLFVDRNVTQSFVPYLRVLIPILFFLTLYLNYKKYNGQYNKLRLMWKDEVLLNRRLKGVLIILVLILPWLPLILVGIYY